MRLKRDRFERLTGRKAEAAPLPPPAPEPQPAAKPAIETAPLDIARLERRLKIMQADLNALPQRIVVPAPRVEPPAPSVFQVDMVMLDNRLAQMQQELRNLAERRETETVWVFDVKRNQKGQIERVEAKKAETE